MNLNNSINALSQLPLKQELSILEYRQCLALAQLETLNLLKIAKIKPAKLTPLPAQFIPKILKLPNPIFKIISKKMLAIDPLARSSMADDLMAGRKTESTGALWQMEGLSGFCYSISFFFGDAGRQQP